MFGLKYVLGGYILFAARQVIAFPFYLIAAENGRLCMLYMYFEQHTSDFEQHTSDTTTCKVSDTTTCKASDTTTYAEQL